MEKRKLTREELSEIRSRAGKKGAEALARNGTWNAGRPKSANKIVMKALTIHADDYDVFVGESKRTGRSIVDTMHGIAVALSERVC